MVSKSHRKSAKNTSSREDSRFSLLQTHSFLAKITYTYIYAYLRVDQICDYILIAAATQSYQMTIVDSFVCSCPNVTQDTAVGTHELSVVGRSISGSYNS